MPRLATTFATAVAIAVVALAACDGESTGPRDPKEIKVEGNANVTTVVTVSWRTETPTVGYVEYGLTRALGSKTPIENQAKQDHAAMLFGLRGDHEYFYRVVTWEASAAAGASKIATLKTGALPLDLPDLMVTGTGHSGFIVTPLLGATRAVVILDSEGQIVWYRCVLTNASGEPDCSIQPAVEDDRLDAYRARLSNDGKSVLFNVAKISGAPTPKSYLARVSLDGSTFEKIPVPFLAHDFVEHPDGTLATLAFEDRTIDGTLYRGSKVVEIAPDATQRTVWTSWDCFDPAIMGDDFAFGWTFANALDFDAVTDSYYVGLRGYSSIAKVNRSTAKCDWVFGKLGNTFTFADGAARFLHQHQFELRGNRILVMDNDGMGGQTSRVLEYELDFTAMTAKQVWSFTSMPKVYVFVLGEPLRLSDGGVFINWSAAGQMERLDSTGKSVWKLNSSAGTIFGFHTLTDDLYAGLRGVGTATAAIRR